uniref:Uncharacterized sensor-like histidine kinase ycf26 n=1 Tax=Callithamnion tetricum TaxID=193179 RepID=A0A4D6WNA9_9FLOR|nr:Drug sensory protein A [Callithamnion tetricum]
MFFYKRLHHFLSLKWKLICNNIRISVILTLFISICVTCFISLILNSLRENFLVVNNLLYQDLGVILGSKIVDLIDWNNYKQLVSFFEKVYISTSSIRYILLFHSDGTLLLSVPTYGNKIQDLLQLHQSLLQLETHDFLFNTPLVKYSTLFNENITDILIPLTKNGYNIASLDIGITSNFLFYTSLKFMNIISLVIFISVWLVTFIISFINDFMLKAFINNTLEGINNISLGNFNYRMDLTTDKEVNNLVVKFNTMADKLKYHEEQNINKLIIEKNKLELIIENIEYGVILLDSELRVLLINDVASKIFLAYRQDVIGKSIIDYLPFHVTKALLPILNNLVKYNFFENKVYMHEEIYIHLHDNLKTVFRFILKTIIDQTNSILIGVVIIVKDISKEVSLNETKNQFMSNVSHELRTPLCNINSLLETLLDYNDSLFEYQKLKFLKIANHETRRLSKLVNDILDLSKLDSNSNYLLDNLDIVLILKYIINTFQIMAKKNNIKLILEIDPSIQYVLAHESSLCQVLYNLLSNSIKFTNYDGYIIIRVYSLMSIPIDHFLLSFINYQNCHTINIVRIEIIDEGIGIDKINQRMIFNRFIRIENNIHTLQGTGLGLSIVKNILSKYETQIYLHSFLKIGTSVCFDLIKTR